MLQAKKEGGFDAVFLAVGAHIAKRAYIPANEAAKIMDAVRCCAAWRSAEKPLLGRRVVVYGGGNTAIDVARTAKRLGAEEAMIVYRRTREKMPAHDFEVQDALEEGVLIKWLSTIKQAGEGSITVEKMELDEKGVPQPTGEFETLEADSVVLALGQDVDLSLLDRVPGMEIEDGVVKVDANMMTAPRRHLRRRRHGARRTHGDGGHRPRQEGRAQHRRVAARRRLRSRPEARARRASTSSTPGTTRTPRRRVRPMLDMQKRVTSFDEVVMALDETTALFEARRCLSCGNCFECDNCYGVCPDNAVIKLGPGSASASTTTTARAADCARASAPAARSPRWRKRYRRSAEGRGR